MIILQSTENLSSAHFSNENVWRAQLPSDDKFAEMKESPIPFIFLGYDEENDVYATWNPHKVKQRLNEAKYVSFYSRLSAQKAAHDEDRFVRQELNNEGKVSVNVRFADEDVWLTQEQLSIIYDTTQQNISQHVINIYNDKELKDEATHKKFLLVRKEGSRNVKRLR